MKIDIEKLNAAKNAYLAASASKNAAAHKIYIPKNEKEQAKSFGARWNSAAGYYEFRSINPDVHPCGRWLTKNYVKLNGDIPQELRETFADLGVVTVKEGDEWHNYVMQHEDYAQLIAALMEIELL